MHVFLERHEFTETTMTNANISRNKGGWGFNRAQNGMVNVNLSTEGKTSWWFQPISKLLVKNYILICPNRGAHKKIFKKPPPETLMFIRTLSWNGATTDHGQPGPLMQRKATVNDFTKPVTEILKAVQSSRCWGWSKRRMGNWGSGIKNWSKNGKGNGNVEIFTKMFQMMIIYQMISTSFVYIIWHTSFGVDWKMWTWRYALLWRCWEGMEFALFSRFPTKSSSTKEIWTEIMRFPVVRNH